ncbi:hypothetical protein [Micromonospora sp. NPDC005174]|uniref:hypothetical protein n=1 Tax=Micromonospora sp. NPDC005174 TaxID=3157018 RepID=UPI0033B7539C
MTRLRRIFGTHGQHRPGFVRPLSDAHPASDPWAKAEADDPLTDTMQLAVIL